MPIQFIGSVKAIEKKYGTGEEPVLVMCSDMNAYVCKYMRSSSTAYKLACELIGSQMAQAWRLNTPEVAFVHIKQEHWAGLLIPHNLSAPAIGSKWLNGVLDITPSSMGLIEQAENTLQQLLEIALFDFWIANEDRNANNANLLYDIEHNRFVSIDYGCILNTATFDYPISQLTSTDTILWSDLFQHISHDVSQTVLHNAVNNIRISYETNIKRSENQIKEIVDILPSQWMIPADLITVKLQQLFDKGWKSDVWDNFTECLYENIN